MGLPQTGLPQAPIVQPIASQTLPPHNGYKQHVMDSYSDFFRPNQNSKDSVYGQNQNSKDAVYGQSENFERVLYDNVDGSPVTRWAQQRIDANSTGIAFVDDDDEFTRVENVSEFDSEGAGIGGQFSWTGINPPSVDESLHGRLNTVNSPHSGVYGPSSRDNLRSEGYSPHERVFTNENGTLEVEKPATRDESSSGNSGRSGSKMRYSEILGTSYQGEMMKMMNKLNNGHS